ncbi:hypothetical protein [Tengunoibacter tsumagoiensis]|uniref:Uncharacterized protein n=1 Tax=Tengunoibacter tsumagoiensis TaxID=2014871 RepID=A0A401ZW98_9CHLR|nr:hypothetical protein [Tengunoibacter tsumagoiensis]GCE11181.1 hypothetical protein KTT_10400 [Tengunoibacter tsumagoiensis]
MLLSGGLIVVGILALLGAFFVLRTGKKSQTSPSAQVENLSTQTLITQQPARPPEEVPQLEFARPLHEDVPQLEFAGADHASAVTEATHQDQEQETFLEQIPQTSPVISDDYANHQNLTYVADEQVHELVEQLYHLKQQANEIEGRLQRVSHLIELIEASDMTQALPVVLRTPHPSNEIGAIH